MIAPGQRSSAALIGLVALAGCATGVPIEREVVVAGSRFTAVQGEARLTVRTFLDDRSEVIGARCAVVSSLYQAELVTPARLVVPNFGPQSPELSFDCRAGELTGRAHAEIVTTWRDFGGAAPGPYPWGGPYGWDPWGWGWGWDGPAYPVSDYPNVAVTLR